MVDDYLLDLRSSGTERSSEIRPGSVPGREQSSHSPDTQPDHCVSQVGRRRLPGTALDRQSRVSQALDRGRPHRGDPELGRHGSTPVSQSCEEVGDRVAAGEGNPVVAIEVSQGIVKRRIADNRPNLSRGSFHHRRPQALQSVAQCVSAPAWPGDQDPNPLQPGHSTGDRPLALGLVAMDQLDEPADLIGVRPRVDAVAHIEDVPRPALGALENAAALPLHYLPRS